MLKATLVANALSCLVFGTVFAAIPAVSAAFIGSPPAWIVMGLGIGLVLNGAALLLTARQATPRRGNVLLFAAGDALWVLATMVLVATGIWIDAVLPSVFLALWVGACGLSQWRLAPAR